jgi:hypothetical protein
MIPVQGQTHAPLCWCVSASNSEFRTQHSELPFLPAVTSGTSSRNSEISARRRQSPPVGQATPHGTHPTNRTPSPRLDNAPVWGGAGLQACVVKREPVGSRPPRWRERAPGRLGRDSPTSRSPLPSSSQHYVAGRNRRPLRWPDSDPPTECIEDTRRPVSAASRTQNP